MDRVPKSTYEAAKIKLTKAERAYNSLQLQAIERWCDNLTTSDQKPRQKLALLFEKGLKLDSEFFYQPPDQLSPELREDQKTFKEALAQMEYIDKRNTAQIKYFIQKYGFPSIHEFSPKVVHTVWLMAQHADDAGFQKEVLKKMVEKRNKPEINDKPHVSLVYFYYLTDRIALKQSNYQYFGTQIGGEKTIGFSTDFRQQFNNDPPGTCLQLLEQSNSPNTANSPPQTKTDKEFLMHAWSKAYAEGLQIHGKNLKYQDAITPTFVEQYSEPQDQSTPNNL